MASYVCLGVVQKRQSEKKKLSLSETAGVIAKFIENLLVICGWQVRSIGDCMHDTSSDTVAQLMLAAPGLQC